MPSWNMVGVLEVKEGHGRQDEQIRCIRSETRASDHTRQQASLSGQESAGVVSTGDWNRSVSRDWPILCITPRACHPRCPRTKRGSDRILQRADAAALSLVSQDAWPLASAATASPALSSRANRVSSPRTNDMDRERGQGGPWGSRQSQPVAYRLPLASPSPNRRPHRLSWFNHQFQESSLRAASLACVTAQSGDFPPRFLGAHGRFLPPVLLEQGTRNSPRMVAAASPVGVGGASTADAGEEKPGAGGPYRFLDVKGAR